MTTTDKRKKRLLEELKDKEYRDAYVSSSVDVGVAFQIRTLRDQKQWNQTELAEKAKMQQERISVLENPSHSPTLATLKKLASAFDVGLIVRFAPTSELVKYELGLHSKSLEVPSFGDENYFKEKPTDESSIKFLADHYSKDAGLGIQPDKQSNVVELSSYRRQKQQYGIEKESSISIQNKMSEDRNEATVS